MKTTNARSALGSALGFGTTVGDHILGVDMVAVEDDELAVSTDRAPQLCQKRVVVQGRRLAAGHSLQPVQAFPSSVFLDKNRCDIIGKISVKVDRKGWKRLAYSL